MANEIILYQPNKTVKLEVRLENDTVWLTQAQIAELFGTKRPAITKHLRNIFSSGELTENSVCSILELTAADGKIYKTRHYNLDAILSVGYRVNSVNATRFRQWSNSILKQYLLRRQPVDLRRFESLEDRVSRIETRVEDVEVVVKTVLPPREGLFFSGQVYDAFKFIREIITSAKSEIILIDNYIDESVLTMMSDKSANVSARIFTRKISQPLALAARKFNEQYGALTLTPFSLSHDRFLIIDRKKLYLIGASLKDLGKKWFGVTEMDTANIPRIVSALRA